MTGEYIRAKKHRVTREVVTQSLEEIRVDRYGRTDTDLLTEAINETGEWVCDCGAGPFEDKGSAENHLENAVLGIEQ